MKKLLLTILTFCYLLVSTGFAYDVHYCMGKEVGVELFANEKEKCGRCGMTEKETGCCHDEHHFYKLDTPGKNVQPTHVNLQQVWVALPQFNQLIHFTQSVTAFLRKVSIPHMPIASSPPIYIRHGVFRL